MCFLLLRNESTNDRLLALENQIKILSTRDCCVSESGLIANPEEISGKPMIGDSDILVGKTEIPVARSLNSHSGRKKINNSQETWLLDFSTVQLMNDKSVLWPS